MPNVEQLTDPDTGEGALHVAAAKNDETLVMQLLDLGASLATQDIQGKTPLMTACEYGHLQALEALAARGVNLAGNDQYILHGYCMFVEREVMEGII